MLSSCKTEVFCLSVSKEENSDDMVIDVGSTYVYFFMSSVSVYFYEYKKIVHDKT